MRHQIFSLFVAAALTAACDSSAPQVIDAVPAGEGVAFDEDNPGADVEDLKSDRVRTYEVPEDLPVLERPEVIVSLKTRTVHLFDRATGFSAVYPTGPGTIGSDGTSITPSGFYETGSNPGDSWYYVERRYSPDYFGGFPFLRLTIPNSKGHHTYGFHGPISYTCPNGGNGCELQNRDWFLRHDYVSHGCMRMESDDIVDMFWMLRDVAEVPIAIIDGVETDARGEVVDLGTQPTLWEEGDEIDYAECGSRPDPWLGDDRWSSRHC